MWWCSLQFKVYRVFFWRVIAESSWNVMEHGDARNEKWKGNCRMHLVASRLHTTSVHAAFSITTSDAHTSDTSIRLNWRPPADLNGIICFAAEKRCDFCSCAIIFQSQSTAYIWFGGEAMQSAHVHCCLQTVGSMCVESFQRRSWRHNFLLKSEDSKTPLSVIDRESHFKGLPFHCLLRNSEGPPKSCQTKSDLWKMLQIAEFRMPTPQDVWKKGSKILKLLWLPIVLH